MDEEIKKTIGDISPEDEELSNKIMQVITPPTMLVGEVVSALKQQPIGVIVFCFDSDGDVVAVTGNSPPSKMIPALQNLIEVFKTKDIGEFTETVFADTRGKAN